MASLVAVAVDGDQVAQQTSCRAFVAHVGTARGDAVEILPDIAVAPLEAVRLEVALFQESAEVVTVEALRQALDVGHDEVVGHRREAPCQAGEVVGIAGDARVTHDVGKITEHQVVVMRLGMQEACVGQRL